MRVNSAQKVGKSVAKLAVAALLASAATGCSSDSSRFSGLFSKDELTTASIPQRPVGGAYGQAPMPRDDVRSGQAVAPVQQDYGSRNTAMNQPYPASPAAIHHRPAPLRRRWLSSATSWQLPACRLLRRPLPWRPVHRWRLTAVRALARNPWPSHTRVVAVVRSL